MRRLEADLWSGLFGLLACVATAVPVLVAQVQGNPVTVIPSGLWWICFAAFLAALVACAWLSDRPARRTTARYVFTAQVGLGATLVLSAPRAGWTPILLVFTTALSGYFVRLSITIVITMLNTAVVALAASTVSDEAVEVLLVALLYLLLQLGSVLGVLSSRRETETRRQLAEAHTRLRAASALLAESTRADERLRIARELHDLLGHQLTVLTLELEVAAHKSAPPANEHVDRANRIARELLADVRSTVGELRNRAPDLRMTLERIVTDIPELTVYLHVDDAVQTDEARTAALVRCVQEVVTNTIRHAAATQLWIEITTTARGELTFTAWDDGYASGPVVPGHGLRGITERITELGGRTEFSANRGFRVVAKVPAP